VNDLQKEKICFEKERNSEIGTLENGKKQSLCFEINRYPFRKKKF